MRGKTPGRLEHSYQSIQPYLRQLSLNNKSAEDIQDISMH